jgi:SAM-dependent methyltransferase
VLNEDSTGSDETYLRDRQYGSPTNLTARAGLHIKYGTADVAWFPWLASQVQWQAGDEVLEVGCGPGWMWSEAAPVLPAGLRLTLTDLSPAMVRTAAERAGANPGLTVVEVTVANVQDLPFDDARFDVVVANHMLYHAPDPSAAVAEIARVLRSDGVVLAATNGPDNLRQLWEIQSSVFGGPAISSWDERFGSVTGVGILGAAFAEVEWRGYEDELRCTDVDDVLAYLTSTPPGESATAAERGLLRERIRERLDEGAGIFTVVKDSGAFLAHGPRS